MVDGVGYPELPGHPDHALAKTLLPRGCGAVFPVDLKATREQGRRFIESLRVFSHLANVGDAKSLVIHPASTTHSQLTEEEQASTGVTPGLVRLSVGIEDVRDIIADIDQALKAATTAVAAGA